MDDKEPIAMSEEAYPWFATNEKQFVQITEPRFQMGGMVNCRNKEGQEWLIPFEELETAEKHKEP